MVIDGLQRLMGGELDKDAHQGDIDLWAEAENLRMAIKAELQDTPDLLWQMMRERGAVEMCSANVRRNRGTRFLWPLSKDSGPPAGITTLDIRRVLSNVGLSMESTIIPAGRGWSRYCVTVFSS